LRKRGKKIKSILIAVDAEVLVQNVEDLLEATLMCLAFYYLFNLAFTKDNRALYNSILGLLLLQNFSKDETWKREIEGLLFSVTECYLQLICEVKKKLKKIKKEKKK